MNPTSKSLFESLKIERKKWGPDDGKLVAEICIRGNKTTTTMILPDEVAERLLKVAKEAVIDGVEQAANDFIFELTTAIPETLLQP
jgi:stalled ribosome rescue protein Dom34